MTGSFVDGEAAGESSGEVTMKATVSEVKMIRNDGPKREAMCCQPRAETVRADGSFVMLFAAWPHGEVRMVESNMVETVMNFYDRPGRPMTILED